MKAPIVQPSAAPATVHAIQWRVNRPMSRPRPAPPSVPQPVKGVSGVLSVEFFDESMSDESAAFRAAG